MKQHRLKTIEDILNVVNEENYRRFLKDFKEVIKLGVGAKKATPVIKLDEMLWTDDGVHEINGILINGENILEHTEEYFHTELKVFEIARLEKGKWQGIHCDFPVTDVLIECPTENHRLTGVCYFIEGSSVFVSSKISTNKHIFVTCKLQVPSEEEIELM